MESKRTKRRLEQRSCLEPHIPAGISSVHLSIEYLNRPASPHIRKSTLLSLAFTGRIFYDSILYIPDICMTNFRFRLWI